jgi:hypothetical protein
MIDDEPTFIFFTTDKLERLLTIMPIAARYTILRNIEFLVTIFA